MRFRMFAVVLAAALLASVVTGGLALQRQASAQGLPQLRSIIFQGNVTINGDPSPNGFRLTAKIRNTSGEIIYTSPETIVGKSVDSRYTTLVVGPAAEAEGRTIEFWLDDQVISTNVNLFLPLLNGRPCSAVFPLSHCIIQKSGGKLLSC